MGKNILATIFSKSQYLSPSPVPSCSSNLQILILPYLSLVMVLTPKGSTGNRLFAHRPASQDTISLSLISDNLIWFPSHPVLESARGVGGADLVADTQWNLWNLYVDEGVVHGSSLFHLVNVIHRVLGKGGKEGESLKPSEET